MNGCACSPTDGFLCSAEVPEFDITSFAYFCFCYQYFKDLTRLHSPQNIIITYAFDLKCFPYMFSSDSVMGYSEAFAPFSAEFSVCWKVERWSNGASFFCIWRSTLPLLRGGMLFLPKLAKAFYHEGDIEFQQTPFLYLFK